MELARWSMFNFALIFSIKVYIHIFKAITKLAGQTDFSSFFETSILKKKTALKARYRALHDESL